MHINSAMVEKDYFVTLFLKHLFTAEPRIVFKGGTCLSKCFGLIDRFSEDIDITMRPDATQKQKKGLKYHIVDTANKLGLEHTNADSIMSGRSYANHKIAFPSSFMSDTLKPLLIVETFFRPVSLSTLTMPASSLLYEHLRTEEAYDVIAEYGLEPFDATVQSLNITFIDKLYALIVYHLKNRVEGRSRHLYDLHRILPHIELNGEFFRLLEEMGEYERNDLASMRSPIDIDPSMFTTSLRNIISEEVYKKDYETKTLPLLFDAVPYKETVRSLQSVIDRIDAEGGEFLVDKPMNFIVHGRKTAKA